MPERNEQRGWWRIHALLVEAAVLLMVARTFVRFVPFGRWRGSLGKQGGRIEPGREIEAVTEDDHYLARVVERAAIRLPFETKCLPRAMALQWMLRRRGRSSTLLIGVLPGTNRGGLDDLHAWVDRGGETLIGSSTEPYVVLTHFAF